MHPGCVLFLAFIAIPLVEVYLLIRVGGIIGGLPTIAAVVATAALGAILLRAQGIATIGRAQAAMNAGVLPALEVVEGVMLLIAGALLLTPGFMTDAIGFLLLTPPVRRLLIKRLRVHSIPTPPGGGTDGGPRVIEGDFRRED